MKIAGLQKVTLIDFPERIAASIFLAGCNLDCAFCHNRWMIDPADVKPVLSMNTFFDWLENRVDLLDGICVSGGEPTIHRDLPDFLRAIKELGFETKLDTNGTLPDRLEPLFSQELVDYVAMDVKAPLDERYASATGRAVDVDKISRSMSLIRHSLPGYEFRTTVEPRLSASDMGEIAELMRPGDTWYLQAFEPAPGVTLDIDRLTWPDKEELVQLAQKLEGIAPGVRVRGALTAEAASA